MWCVSFYLFHSKRYFRLLTCLNMLYFFFTFYRLFKDGCRSLKYLDVSGCRGITDKTLTKLSQALGKPSTPTCDACTCGLQNTHTSYNNNASKSLEILRLSGCYKITDVGLRLAWLHTKDLIKHYTVLLGQKECILSIFSWRLIFLQSEKNNLFSFKFSPGKIVNFIHVFIF